MKAPFNDIVQAIERFIIMIAQFIFIISYAIIYIVSQRTAHRIVGYFNEIYQNI